MEISLTKYELEKALTAIKEAENNGFNFCEGVFQVVGMHGLIGIGKYSDLWEKAHPTDPSLNWGRFQSVTKRKKFIDGKLKDA